MSSDQRQQQQASSNTGNEEEDNKNDDLPLQVQAQRRSKGSIPTDELTDLYNSSGDESKTKSKPQTQSNNAQPDLQSLNALDLQKTANRGEGEVRIDEASKKSDGISQALKDHAAIEIHQSYNETQMLKYRPNIDSEQQQAIQISLSASPSPKASRMNELDELKHIIELQRQQLDRMQSENQQQQTTINRLNEVMATQGEEILNLKRRLDHQNTLSSSNDDQAINNRSSLRGLNQNQVLGKNSKNSLQNSVQVKRQGNAAGGQSTDFWKENDQEFYSTKNPKGQSVRLEPLKPNRNAVILEQMKQDLWVSKERAQQQTHIEQTLPRQLRENNQQKTRSQAVLPDLRSSSKKKEKIKSSTIKKAEKKVFNEDLVEIGDQDQEPSGVGNSQRVVSRLRRNDEDQFEDYKQPSSRLQSLNHHQPLNQPSLNSPYSNQSIKQSTLLHNKNQSLIVGAAHVEQQSQKAKSLRRPMGNPIQIDKLEALKFKMSLQARNLKLIKEHDAFIRDIEKRQVGGKRENKIQTIQTVTRLYKDLERTQKQLRQEIVNAQRLNGGEIDRELLQECNSLFREADEYFAQYQQEMDERKVRKNYGAIGSRINTNLKGVKHTKLIVLNQEHNNDHDQEDMEDGENDIRYVEQEVDVVQNYEQQHQPRKYQSNHKNSQSHSMSLKSKASIRNQLQQQQDYVGDIGASNYMEANHRHQQQQQQYMPSQHHSSQQHYQSYNQKTLPQRERDMPPSGGVKLPSISNRNSIKTSKRSLY